MKKIRIGYLISRYPAISHTFILNEILNLRQLGLVINVASVNAPDRDMTKLTQIEKEEANQTYYVKDAGIKGAIIAHISTFFSRPLSYSKGLIFALRLGKFDLKSILFQFFYFVEAVMVGRWMHRLNLNHLHIHMLMAATSVGLISSRVFPITYSITVHGSDEFWNVSQYALKEKIIYARFICCITYFTRSQLMVLSQPQHWNKLEINRLGVDIHKFSPRSHKENQKSFNLICVGRLVTVKGHLILIQALKILIEQEYDLSLTLVGDGPERERLEQKVIDSRLEKSVTFAGEVDIDHIVDFYHKADIFVLASFTEGLPIVLMEAMAVGLPCVTTQITGIPELVIPEKNGLLVAPSDVTGLANAILALVENPSLYYQTSQAGRQRVIADYNLEKNTHELAKTFIKHIGD